MLVDITKIEATPRSKEEVLKEIFSTASQHGLNSDPDHEVGDLQAALRAAFEHISDEQASALAAELELWSDNDEED